MKYLAVLAALLAAPAFAQSNPIGGDGGAGLAKSYTTPGNPYYGRPLPRTMSGWDTTWGTHRDLRASKAFMWGGFAAPACCNDFSSPD